MDERIPPLRIKEGDKRSLSPWIMIIIFLFLMGILFVLFLQSPLNRIAYVHVQGNHLLKRAEVLKLAKVGHARFFFETKASRMEEQLKRLPEVQDAEVEKSFPNRLDIQIREYPIVAYTQTDDGSFIPVLWNDTVVPARRTAELIEAWPIIEKKERTNEAVLLALRNLSRLPVALRREIEFVYAVPAHVDQVKLLSARHHQIYIRAHDLTNKLPYYPRFRAHPPGTLYLLHGVWFHAAP